MAGATIRIAILAQAAKAKAELKDLADQAEESVGRVKKSWDGLGDKTKGALAAGGAAAGAALVAGVTGALAQGDLTAKLGTQLGLAGPEAAKYGKLAGQLYGENFGTDTAQVGEAIKRVYQDIGEGNDQWTKDITAQVLTVANTFDQDLGGTTAAVGQLLRTGLAPDAKTALDIITAGLQSGADKSGDLLDTFNEYGTQFRKFGLDGATATGLLTQGLQAGARDADVVADAIKEFSIKSQEALYKLDSKGTPTLTALGLAFEQVGVDGEAAQAAIAAGGPGATKALDDVLDGLRGIEDPTQRAQAAVALFGTQAEDLGDALFALDPSEATRALGDVSGAAQKAVDSMGATPAAKIEAFKRSLQQGFTNIAGGLAGFATANSSWLVPLLGTLGGIAAVIYTVNLATKVWAATQAAITAVTKAWKVAQLALNVTFLANPVFLIVAGVIALVAAIVIAYKKSETFRQIVQAVWSAIKSAIGAVIDWFTTTIPKVWEKAKEVWSAIKSAAETVWNAIKTAVNVAIMAITAYINAYKTVVLAIWNGIKTAATTAWNLIKAAVQAVIAGLTAILNAWRNLVFSVWDGIKSAAATAWNAIKKTITDAINTAKDTVSSVIGKIKALFSPTTLYNAGRELIGGLVSGIAARIGDAIEKVRAGVAKIKGLLPGSPIKWGPLTSWNNGGAGKRLMDLLADGIRSGAPGVSAALSDGISANAAIGISAIDQIAPTTTAPARAVTIEQLTVSVPGSFDLASAADRKAAAEAMVREIQEALVAYEGGRR